MIDIVGILMENILYVLLITLGGMLISFSVHFVPVGGAPAAMAQATGIGTGTVQLAAGAGLTGLAVTMIVGQWVYVYGVGCPPASAKVKYDPITKDRQDLYVSQGTEGHGLPTVSYVSGVIGGLLGGSGGSLVYFSLMTTSTGLVMADLVGLASVFAVEIQEMAKSRIFVPDRNIYVCACGRINYRRSLNVSWRTRRGSPWRYSP
jgi:tetrahydromethanopterin S-methyltransferase subunit D